MNVCLSALKESGTDVVIVGKKREILTLGRMPAVKDAVRSSNSCVVYSRHLQTPT